MTVDGKQQTQTMGPWVSLLMKNEGTREYYDAETGDGLGLDPFWGWSLLGYFMPLEFHERYDPSGIDYAAIVPYAKKLLTEVV